MKLIFVPCFCLTGTTGLSSSQLLHLPPSWVRPGTFVSHRSMGWLSGSIAWTIGSGLEVLCSHVIDTVPAGRGIIKVILPGWLSPSQCGTNIKILDEWISEDICYHRYWTNEYPNIFGIIKISRINIQINSP